MDPSENHYCVPILFSWIVFLRIFFTNTLFPWTRNIGFSLNLHHLITWVTNYQNNSIPNKFWTGNLLIVLFRLFFQLFCSVEYVSFMGVDFNEKKKLSLVGNCRRNIFFKHTDISISRHRPGPRQDPNILVHLLQDLSS